jgi:DNA-binding transcriptional LysR family regulator
MKDLSDECFVLKDPRVSSALFNTVMSLCAGANFAPAIATMATTSASVIALVEAGEGIAILSQSSSRMFSNDLSFLPVMDALASIDIVLAWSPQQETPVLRSFLELVRRKKRPMKAK